MTILVASFSQGAEGGLAEAQCDYRGPVGISGYCKLFSGSHLVWYRTSTPPLTLPPLSCPLRSPVLVPLRAGELHVKGL